MARPRLSVPSTPSCWAKRGPPRGLSTLTLSKPELRVSTARLWSLRSNKEIKATIWGMDQNSAPRPDGLGPSF
jgi:hypothetical protein